MKKIVTVLMIACSLLNTGRTYSQVGIGTITPDTSAILDLYSDHLGFLMPRMTTIQRDLIQLPATGLQIYNQDAGEVEVNTGTPSLPVWWGMKDNQGDVILSVTATGDINTSSTTSVLIPGMTLSPPAGTYLVLFNGQYGLTASEPISTQQGVADLLAAYNQLMAFAPTNTTHAAVFGNGETIAPGIYDVAGAASMAGLITLDGGADTNSVFIFRIGGALSAGAMTTVVLINGASANNIFWVAEGAVSLGANTRMSGTLIAHAGAVSAAAGSDFEGRMFSLTGAISFGPGTGYIPSGISYIDLGVLESFFIFASSGAISNTEPSDITGDVGTNAGTITGFDNIDGNIYGPGSQPIPVNNTVTTFSIYQNGVLVANSSRTSDINTSMMTLQAMATVAGGEPIEVWWKVDEGPVILGNRILTLVK